MTVHCKGRHRRQPGPCCRQIIQSDYLRRCMRAAMSGANRTLYELFSHRRAQTDTSGAECFLSLVALIGLSQTCPCERTWIASNPCAVSCAKAPFAELRVATAAVAIMEQIVGRPVLHGQSDLIFNLLRLRGAWKITSRRR